MKYGIARISIIPCRAEPADMAEQVSQILFGEAYQVLEERAKWVRIRNSFDRYEGWIDRNQHFEITENEFKVLAKTHFASAELVSLLRDKNTGTFSPIVLGSTLPNYENGALQISSGAYEFLGDARTYKQADRSKLVEDAHVYLNAPYLWGGRSPFGIDCSGFTQLVYKLNGIALPRDAKDQAKEGVTLSFIEEAEPGDLAFFDNQEGNIIHVGILLGDNYIIHASGKVRIDRIDHQGIYNVEKRDYSHKLRIIKQLL